MIKLKNLARLNVAELQALIYLTHPVDTCEKLISFATSKEMLIDIIEADVNNACAINGTSWTSLEVKNS